MKRGMFLTTAAVFLVACTLMSGCYTQQDPVFGDCDTFLAYYDSCVRFVDAYPGSVCEVRYPAGDISVIDPSDKECYPMVQCTEFRQTRETADWLRKCRYLDVSERCVMSFDVSCDRHAYSDDLVSVTLTNRGEGHMKKIQLQLVSDAGTFSCRDSDNDRILAVNETDTFYCPVGSMPAVFEAEMVILYEDYKTGAMNTKTGRLAVLS